MPSAAANIKSVRFIAGGSNAPAINDTIFIALMEELKYGTLPTASPLEHAIIQDILFRASAAAVVANPTAVPPVEAAEAIMAGGFIAIEVARKKSAYKTQAKNEEGYTHYDPMLEVVVPFTNASTSHIFRHLNGARVVLGFRDNNGAMRVAANVLVKVEPGIDDNSNSYKLSFDFGPSGIEPYFYKGAMVMRG